MSRRIILLAGLSVAAIFLASLVLLQGRSDVTRPLFPKPWGPSSDTTKSESSSAGNDGDGASESWLKEHLSGLGGMISTPHESADPVEDAPTPDVTAKPDSPALSDSEEEDKPKGGDTDLGEAPPSAGDMAQAHQDEEDQGLKDKVTSSFGQDSAKPSGGAEVDSDSADNALVNVTIAETGGFHDEVINIDVVEVGGSHDEVIAALIHSFGTQSNVQLDLYQRLQRYGIKNIFEQFELSRPLPKYKWKALFNASDHTPEILVSTTCELDSVEHRDEWAKLLEQKKTYLFCVIHHADRWGNETKCHDVVRPWAREGLVEFVGLSKHTQNYLEEELKNWDLGGVKPKTRHYIPVFPATLPDKYLTGKEDELGFALQGDFDPNRRDYGKIFDHLGGFLNQASESGSSTDLDSLELHLIGHGKKPAVPPELESHVRFDEGLDYLDFYGILSRTFALLPAFASAGYLDRKASSTVPASLIAGTPLVATQEILDAYTYLPKEAVWLQEEGEEDFDVIGRILAMSPEQRKAKKDAVKKATLERVELNKVMVAEWMREGQAFVRSLHKESSNGTAYASADSADSVGSEETDDGPGAGSGEDRR